MKQRYKGKSYSMYDPRQGEWVLNTPQKEKEVPIGKGLLDQISHYQTYTTRTELKLQELIAREWDKMANHSGEGWYNPYKYPLTEAEAVKSIQLPEVTDTERLKRLEKEEQDRIEFYNKLVTDNGEIKKI